MHVGTGSYLLLFLALPYLMPHGSFGQEPTNIAQSPSAIGTYSIVPFNGNHSFLIQIQQSDSSFTTPRKNYYLGVGGDGLQPSGVSIWNSSGFKMGDTRATGGIIWLPRLPTGNYTVTTADIGRFLLAQDVQNSGEKFVGNLSAPVALFIVPFQKSTVQLDTQVSHSSDGYRLDLYNSSSSFDFTLPSQGASLLYARISPDQLTTVQFTWTSSPTGPDIIGLIPIILPVVLIAGLVVFVIFRSRRKV